MRILFFCYLLLASQLLYGFSFLQNPDFSSGFSGWESSNVNARIYSMDSKIFQDKLKKSNNFHISHDKILALRGNGSVSNQIFPVPANVPLYVYLKIGHREKNPVRVRFELIEGGVIPQPCRREGKKMNCRGIGYHNSIYTKSVSLPHPDKWFNIYSEFPVYKAHDATFLKLIVEVFHEDSEVYISYAQVTNGDEVTSVGDDVIGDIHDEL